MKRGVLLTLFFALFIFSVDAKKTARISKCGEWHDQTNRYGESIGRWRDCGTYTQHQSWTPKPAPAP